MTAPSYPGEHQPIITRDLWEKVRSIIAESPRQEGRAQPQTDAGIAEGPDLRAKRLRHDANPYAKEGQALPLLRHHQRAEARPGHLPDRRLPAGEIEAAVIDQLRALLRSPEMIVKTWMAARDEDSDISDSEVREALIQFDALWEELFPAEQARIVQLLVERVDVDVDGISIQLRTEGESAASSPRCGLNCRGQLDGRNPTAPNATNITVRVPLAMKKRGGRKLVVSPPGHEPWVPQRQPRRQHLGQSFGSAPSDGARNWSRARTVRSAISPLPSGSARATSRRIMNLSLLAPTIVERILDGYQPRTLTAETLSRGLPDDWNEQGRLLE